MPHMRLDEARRGIRLAHQAIENAVRTGQRMQPPDDLPAIFEELGGVFVTLHTALLRGCVGHPYPDHKIKDALIDAAISAALYDYRFPVVTADELPGLKVEITLLSKPQRITDLSSIIIGKHGLIAKKGHRQGLLLPQVATEYGWTRQEFIDQTYVKAGLMPGESDVELFEFEGQVFSEVHPGGEIIELVP
ncbi:MAG: AmmeMemoRadiSam system protein A [Halobacteriota archaeon]